MGDMTTDSLASSYLRDVARTVRNQKTLADRAVAQVSDEELHALVDDEANSIAVIAKHVTGNLRSRFTDFLTTDGEKPTRDHAGQIVLLAKHFRGAAWTSLSIPKVKSREPRA
jgi:hypothetical protein